MARIWALTGKKRGDNAQVLALADAIGGDVREVGLDWTWWRVLPNSLLGAGLVCITTQARRQLCAPWPDMVIAIGRRSVPVSRSIKRQSGAATCLVHLGNPRARLCLFDLVISTPQYRLPALPNVVLLPLPLSTPPRPPPDLASWHDQWRNLPLPITGMLIGGNAWPYHYTESFARRLVREAMKEAAGGTVIAVTSPRTAEAVAEAIADEMRAPHLIYRWRKDAPNPYRSLLMLADRLRVSGESVSMIGDAVMAGRPVEPIAVPQWPVPEFLTPRDVRAVYSNLALSDPDAARLRASTAQQAAISACRRLLDRRRS